MKIPNDICVKAARVYRTVNRPVLRSKVDAHCGLYADDGASEPIATLKIKNIPEIKLLDLIAALLAMKVALSVIGAVIGIFKD